MRVDPRRVFPSALSACIHALHWRTSPYTRYFPAFLVPSRHAAPKTPLFLPPLSESSPASAQNLGSRPTRRHFRHIIFLILHHRLPRRICARVRTQFMAHVLVLSHPPGPRKSDYAPIEQRHCARNCRASGKGKSHARDNSGSN